VKVVGEASSGDEALGVALVLRPDLIVLDHEMPGTRGLDILPKLRVILPGARIVMFTMSLEISREARRRGAEAIIAKDDLGGLVEMLRRLAVARVGPMPLAARSRLAGRGGWLRAAVVPALALLYVVAFFPLAALFGDQTTDIAILVVAAAGATYGLHGGLIAAVLAPLANLALIRVAGLSTPGAGSLTRVMIALAIGGAFGRLHDLTERANLQARSLADTSAALEASDRRLFGLVHDAPVLIVSIDMSGVIVDALGTGFDHLKFAPELIRGQQAAVLYADDSDLLAQLGRALSGDEFSQRVDRGDVSYDVNFRPRRDETGVLVGTTAVLLNLSGPTRPSTHHGRARGG
jgi:CheY-like chemotaxis protein